jgi:hypothetical protein
MWITPLSKEPSIKTVAQSGDRFYSFEQGGAYCITFNSSIRLVAPAYFSITKST